MAGRWVHAACWHNCGGRCVNKVWVEDGRVVRQATDDAHPDSPAFPQQRGCVRGRDLEQQCFGEDRLLYPLKRKGWRPGGGQASNGQLRGRDEWERIGWDEAIELSCAELRRIYGLYGGQGVYSKHSHPFIDLMGGCVCGWDTTSHGAYSFACEMIGLPSRGLGGANDRLDLPNADYIVLYALNPAWDCAGTPAYHFLQAREAGTRFLCVDPLYNATAQTLDAEWYPVRNGTDMAFLLAVAYEMLRLDEEEGDVVDWGFLERCTVGFDADHMPPDARLNENLHDYLLGAYDGLPKTPEWASPLCGVEPERITRFARVMGKNNKVMLLHNYAAARCNGADLLPQLFMAVGAMGGHMGKPGHACGSAYHADCGNAGPRLVSAGRAELPRTVNPMQVSVRQAQSYELILNGGGLVPNEAEGYFRFHEPRPVRLGPIKAILHVHDDVLQTSPAQAQGIAAHRAVDFVLTRAQFMNTEARYSDIVLPVTTEWERVGSVTESNREFVRCCTQVCPPRGESKTDQEIDTLLLQGMGIDPALAFGGKSEEQQFFEQIAGCRIRRADGSLAPLVTVTEGDIERLGVEGEAQEGVVDLRTFVEEGGYQVPRSADDGLAFIGYADFVADPQAHPLPSNSGKLEIYCQARHDLMRSYSFPNVDRYKPYPTYVRPLVGYEATRGRDGAPGDYPFLLYNPHYPGRAHGAFDNSPRLSTTWESPAFMNREDAEGLGIAEGDAVLVATPHGKSLMRAALLDVLRPGVVGVPHGAWVDVDEATGIDRAGSDNYLLGPDFEGCGLSGYNNQVCNVTKYDGAMPAPRA